MDIITGTTAVTPLLQPANTRLFVRSMAIPVGSSQGARGQVSSTLSFSESSLTSVFWSCMSIKNVPRAIRHRVLDLAAHRLDGSHDLSSFRVQSGDALAATIRGKHPLCPGIEQNAVRVLAHFHFDKCLQSFHVEDGDGAGRPVGDEATAQIVRDGDS